ncbi:MAG: putative lipid II flippase FtsW [Actinomycetota bacterium]|nr:putative lipid II flippase FtsW [Actinomycetota bacterium]
MATRSASIARKGSRARPKSTSRSRSSVESGSTLITLVTFALVLLGLMMILSASFVSSFTNYGSSFLFFRRQLLWVVLGIIGFIFFSHFDYRRLKGAGYLLIAVSIALLFAVIIPSVGVTVGGSARWLGVGSLSFQPSELAKLALILFAADVFSRKQEATLDDLPHTLLPMVPVLAILAGLVMLQPDLGSTILIGSIGIGMLLVAGAPMRFLAPLAGLGGAAATVAALIEPERRSRVLSFLDPWKDSLGDGYQTIQGLIAIGSGGWFGVGLGASRQKWNYVPNAHTDYIFAILGEEMGLLGTFVVLGLFVALAYLGLRTARQAADRYGMLVAAGITIWISVQAFVNVGVVTATLPMTGVPLPLVSFGGSSLVLTLAAVGMLTNIAKHGKLDPVTRAKRARRRESSQG